MTLYHLSLAKLLEKKRLAEIEAEERANPHTPNINSNYPIVHEHEVGCFVNYFDLDEEKSTVVRTEKD